MNSKKRKYSDASNSESIEELGTRDCINLPAKFPIDIRNLLPLRIAVSFTMTEWTCVWGDLFEQHAVGSLEEAISHLIRGHEIFLIYRLYSETVTPAWAYTVDWPLRRRGKWIESVTAQVPHGNDIEVSNAVLEVRNQPLRPYESRLMLKTGGRTPEDAINRWMALAKPLRQLLRNNKQLHGKTLARAAVGISA